MMSLAPIRGFSDNERKLGFLFQLYEDEMKARDTKHNDNMNVKGEVDCGVVLKINVTVGELRGGKQTWKITYTTPEIHKGSSS